MSEVRGQSAQDGGTGEKPHPMFLLLHNPDLVCRCWPGNFVVLGLRVCKWVRHLLRQHTSVRLHTAERCSLPSQICFTGIRTELSLFSQPPEMHLVLDRLFSSQDHDPFSTFFEEIQRARDAGWKGPSLLSLDNSFAANFDAYPLKDRSLSSLAMGIAHSHFLTCLKLVRVELDLEGARRLFGEVLPSLPCLTKINLTDVAVEDSQTWGTEGATWLERLSLCCSLQSITFVGFSGDDKSRDLKDLISGLRTLTNLTDLRISEVNIGGTPGAAIDLAIALSRLKLLKTLSLSYTHLSGARSRVLCRALRSCTSLERLFLAHIHEPDNYSFDGLFYGEEGGKNSIVSEAGLELAASLAGCPKLAYLALDDFLLTEHDGERLAMLLKSCTGLAKLTLQQCAVWPEAVEAMCVESRAFESCSALTSLELDDLRISDEEECEGFNLLMDQLPRLPALQHITAHTTDSGIEFDVFLRILDMPSLRSAWLRICLPEDRLDHVARFAACVRARAAPSLPTLVVFFYDAAVWPAEVADAMKAVYAEHAGTLHIVPPRDSPGRQEAFAAMNAFKKRAVLRGDYRLELDNR